MNSTKTHAATMIVIAAFTMLATAGVRAADAPPRAVLRAADPQADTAPRATELKPAGVAGDGVTDDTAAIQAALDRTGKTGGEVFLGPGRYLVKGSLTVPTGVALRGSWDAPHHGAWDKGTTLLLTGGRGQEDGTAAITLQQSSAVRDLTMVWPDEKADNIVPYPWAIHGSGMHNTVEDVTFVNAYQGIKIGQPSSELHLIRNIFGCVLRRGVFIDSTSDIGRIENVHFNTHYWVRSRYPSIQAATDGATGDAVTGFTEKNLEAFIFGRADWEYVANTFIWGARIGYHFVKTPDGACNGQFMGIGADACDIGVQIDAMQSIGIQVTNGEFTAFLGGTDAGIVIAPNATGAAQFVNCNFWSTPGGAAQIHGNAQATFSACHFVGAAAPGSIVADAGHIIVSSCSFADKSPAVVFLPGVRSGIVMANSQPGGLSVDNRIGSLAQIGMNEGPYTYPAASLGHYRVRIGAGGDEDFLGDGWYGGEDEDDVPADIKGGVRNARWTNGGASLHLPVTPGAAYHLTLWLLTRDKTPVETVSAMGAQSPVAVGKSQRLDLVIPASATTGKSAIDVTISGQPWSPSQLWPGNSDGRKLGARVMAVEMKADGGPATATVLN